MSSDVLARRAVVHVLGMLRADALAERRDERDDRVARGDGRLAQRGRVDRPPAPAIAAAAAAGITPASASAAASAASASSIAATQARADTASRSRAGAKSGREELAHGASARRTAPTRSCR